MPQWLPRFNRAVGNRVQRTWAWLVPPWAVIVHRGRKTGKVYRTPVIAFRSGTTIAVGLPYGAGADWVRNLLAEGQGGIERAGRLHRITAPRVVDTPDDEALPAAARPVARYLNVLLARIED